MRQRYVMDIEVLMKDDIIATVSKAALIYTLLLLAYTHANAFDADIYAGMYFDSTYASSPLRDGSTAKYMNGVSVGHNIGKLRGYINVETLSDQYNNDGSFHPDSIRYTTGLRYNIWKGLSIDAEHLCWHPIDGAGKVEQYNLIKINYHFGEPSKW